MQAIPVGDLSVAAAADSGKPALPGGQGPRGRRAEGADPAVRRGRGANASWPRSTARCPPTTPSALSDLVDKATGKVRPIVWVGIGLATFQQLVGINVVFYYGAVLWQAVGFSENDALLINVLSGALSASAPAW